MRVALVGTRGVPARYGGFETCVEEVGARLASRGHEVTAYCRRGVADDGPLLPEHRGMRLVHLPAVHRRALETLSHSAASVAHLLPRGTDAAVVFNSANAPLLPVLRARGIPVATHVDGLEWKRAKWGGAGRRYYRSAESMAVRWSDALIADAQGISDYYAAEFGAATELIAYGAPDVAERRPEVVASLGLRSRGYHLVVARFEPENNVELIVRGYVASGASEPLVVVGCAPYADAYTARVHAAADERVVFLGGVWDQEVLDQLYANALTYLHGHSVGGTNPSLLRAMGAGAATLAYDVGFNREVLRGAGRFFADAAELSALLEEAEACPEGVVRSGRASLVEARRYDWDDVADAYEDLCERLAARRRSARPSGRRAPHLVGASAP
ncbi:DUF1972 domain-containing protein [uncultured Pseudokineococcus sp.]|uniref:DUF1972 domain-containing protein n=1 Tax=uncultured Pseudokineococcus sp. TaxID=1642928 RepID=UPI0026293753|nr:DUF1972 domain-containing protein [uncultured Pseudokineococcus sp.]